MIFILNDVKPCQYVVLEILNRAVGRFMFYVKNRRQVALFKTYGIKEVVGLRASRRLVAPEVIGATYVSIFACLAEVLLEFVVNAC